MKYISIVSILSLLLAAHVGSAQLTIDFSAEQGFVDGPLHRQPAAGDKWFEQRVGSFTVDAEEGVVIFDSSAESWSNATYANGLATGEVTIFAIEFQLTAGTPKLEGGNAILNRFDLVGEDGVASASIRQRADAPNFFDLWIFDGVGPKPNSSLGSTGFSGEAIGLKANKKGTKYKDGTSDKLRLIIVHRKTGEGALCTSAVVLQNALKNEEIQKVVLPNWDATEGWLNQRGKTFRMTTGNMNERIADKGATSFSIDSIKIGVATE